MGNKLFGVNISKLIKDNVGPGVLDCTLSKFTPGTRTAGSLTGGRNATSADYSCKGFIDSQARRYFDESEVEDGAIFVVLIGDTIGAVPTVGDQITIEGATYTILKIDRDPAAATYTCMSKEA